MGLQNINYSQLESERTNMLQEQFDARLSRRLRADNKGLRGIILGSVVTGSYAEAKKELQDYVASKSEFPNFKPKVERYVSHSTDLINAISAKRNFPGLSTLPTSKQQEMFEKIIEHFDELKYTVMRIEASGYEARLNDIKSTIIVLRTFVYSLFAIAAVAFVIDILTGFYASYERTLEFLARDVVSLISKLFVF